MRQKKILWYYKKNEKVGFKNGNLKMIWRLLISITDYGFINRLVNKVFEMKYDNVKYDL